MWVLPDPAMWADKHPALPAELLTIQRYARAWGCDYILFDADADQIDELPTCDG